MAPTEQEILYYKVMGDRFTRGVQHGLTLALIDIKHRENIAEAKANVEKELAKVNEIIERGEN